MSVSFDSPPQGDYSFTRTQANRLRQLTEAQNVLAWVVLVCVIGIIGTLLLRQASDTALKGRQVWQMEATLDEIHRENERLSNQIARGQSSERLRQAALDSGFTVAELDSVDFIPVDNFPTLIVEPAVVEDSVSPTPISMSEALRLAFSDWLSVLVEGEAR